MLVCFLDSMYSMIVCFLDNSHNLEIKGIFPSLILASDLNTLFEGVL